MSSLAAFLLVSLKQVTRIFVPLREREREREREITRPEMEAGPPYFSIVLTRDTDMGFLSVRPSVRRSSTSRSVRRWQCTETAVRIIKLFHHVVWTSL